MITANKLSLLTNMPTVMLQTALGKASKGRKFTASEFLGITNGGQFCYSVTYPQDDQPVVCKVFLTYDPAADRVIADMA
jgi:hypothetical protein